MGYIFHLISSNCGDNSLPLRVKQNLFCTGRALPRSFYLDAIVPGPRCESNSSSSQRQALGGNEAFKFQNDLMESRKKTKIKIMASKVKHFLHLVNDKPPPNTYKLQFPPHIHIKSTAVVRCSYALATLVHAFQIGFRHYSGCHQCVLFLFTLSPPEPQSKLCTMRWTITRSEMSYGQRAAFSCDNRLRMAVGFSHVSSQVFLTGGGI